MQLAWAGGVAVIDPLAVDVAPLAELFRGGATAVIHAADQDLEVLERGDRRGADAPVRHPAGNVIDQPNYEASGVDKVRDAIKAGGAKLIAGGYNKTTSYDGAPPSNRYLIFQYPDKATHDKLNMEIIRPWQEKVKGKYTSVFRIVGVEAAGQ